MHAFRPRRRGKVGITLVLSAGLTLSLSILGNSSAQAAPLAAAAGAGAQSAASGPELAPGVRPVDNHPVSNLDDLTWNDYVAAPGTNWADPAIVPTIKKWKAAIVLLDYPDQPFQVTQPAGSTIWGNPGPQAHDLPRSAVPQFYKDLLNTPSAINNNHTINEYWMEDTGGRYGVEVTAFGAYQLPKNSYQYHYASYGNGGTDTATMCPVVMLCVGDFRTDALLAWKTDTGIVDPLAEFDNVFYIGAGEDQSSTWLEFGQMMFKTAADVPDAFGPPAAWKAAVLATTGKVAPNASPTRYVPWTAWASTASMWPNALANTSIETESSGAGVYAHEFSHNLKIADNYGNPYAAVPVRDMSGTWDMMSRGSFNGPEGPHERWHVPSVVGSVMGSEHMLRDRMFLGTVTPDSVVNISRSDLTANGVASTTVTAREVQIAGEKAGVNVVLDGGDTSTCQSQGATGDLSWRCDNGGFNNYTLEVVDQMGYDSFEPDQGVLLAKTKDSASPNKWVIDAHPEDIDMVDYYTADGTPVMLGRGDHRQLNDALFKAGTKSGSSYEYEDAANNLHFYVFDKHRTAAGVLQYDVAVRSLAGSGTAARGVLLSEPQVVSTTPGKVAACNVDLTNTGAASGNPLYASDVYRLSASAVGTGWTVVLPQELATATAGASTTVTAYAVLGADAAAGAQISVTATSETDPSQSSTSVCTVTAADTGTVDAEG